MVIFILANVLGSSIQITTLPVVLLAPLQAVRISIHISYIYLFIYQSAYTVVFCQQSGLIFNAILASVLLYEPLTSTNVCGTVLVVFGAFLIAAFGVIPENAYTLKELMEFFVQRAFVLWMVFQGLLLIFLFSFKIILDRYSRLAESYGKLLKIRITQGIILGCISGLLSAHTLLLAKVSVSIILRSFIDHENQLRHVQTWVIFSGVIFTALAQLYFLNAGLRRCSTSILYPLVFCVYNIISILDGLIFYRQAAQMTSLQIGMVIFGTSLLGLGVALLSWRMSSISDGELRPVYPQYMDQVEEAEHENESTEFGDIADAEIPQSSEQQSRRIFWSETRSMFTNSSVRSVGRVAERKTSRTLRPPTYAEAAGAMDELFGSYEEENIEN